MKTKVITMTILLLVTSCFNAVHNKDAVKNSGTFSFQHCNQTLGAKFIEGNCTKLRNTALENFRFCSECPNSNFMLSKEGLIHSITIDSLSKDEFNKYLKDYTSELGAPREMESADDHSYYWKLLKEGKSIALSKRADTKNINNFRYILNIDDINAYGLE